MQRFKSKQAEQIGKVTVQLYYYNYYISMESLELLTL